MTFSGFWANEFCGNDCLPLNIMFLIIIISSELYDWKLVFLSG